MGIYLNPGNGNFQTTCHSEIYVDKTEMIEHTNKALYQGNLLVGINYDKESKKHECVIECMER